MSNDKHDDLTGFIINPTWIVPVIPKDIVLNNHSLVIRGDKILDLLPQAEAILKYPHWPVQKLPQHILIPGLINAHGHSAMSLLRGYADDLELMDWLNNHIWPIENALVDYDFVYDGTCLAIAEMISTGTTCVADSYFFPDAMARAYSDNGFRAQVSAPVIQFKNAWAESETDHIQKALATFDDFQHEPLINPAFAPHAPYTVSNKGFEQIRDEAERLDIPIHLHLHETAAEIELAIRETGIRPLQRIFELGLMSDKLQTVHMTQLNDQEIKIITDTQVHVAHCPDSNLKLASGFCPVSKLISSDVNVSVGTDSAASNNNLDMLSELRSAALLAKGVAKSALSVNAHQALAMGTINGAKMLGLEQHIGSLEVGKLADLAAVDLSAHNFQPIHNPLSQLIYSATGHQVTEVWINGQHLLQNKSQIKCLKLDIDRILANSQQWRNKIKP